MLILVIVSVVDGGDGSGPVQLCFVKWEIFFFFSSFSELFGSEGETEGQRIYCFCYIGI